MKHIKGKWKTGYGMIGQAEDIIDITASNGYPIARTISQVSTAPNKTTNYKTNKANAHFIVTACNNHYELLEACKEMLAFLIKEYPGEWGGYKESLFNVITKAEGDKK